MAMEQTTREELARTAGLSQLATPQLEDVNRRRLQLWSLSLLVGVAIPGVMVALGFDVLGEHLPLDASQARLILLALLVVVMGYVAERESALRGLTSLLVDERILTATLVARIEELDLLLKASKAMNSTLDLHHVLEVILHSACQLLRASEGSIQLITAEDADVLEVAAVHGSSTARIGQQQAVGDGVAGRVAAEREAVLVTGRHRASRSKRNVESAIVVPLQHRETLLGVLNLATSEGAEAFTEFQLRSVAVFAETAAAAIANARAHTLSEERINALTELDSMKNAFLTLVTHELRTPLTSLIGLTTTIAEHGPRLEGEQIAQLADMARKQGWRLERLVGDLLHSAAAQEGRLELQPAPTELGHTITDLVRTAQEGTATHQIRFAPPARTTVRCVDADALSRILVNLIGNAVKYAPEGTPITVELDVEEDRVVIAVLDEGPGIPEDARAELFEKFQRGPQAASVDGLGLGLFIVRSLAEAHGGGVVIRPRDVGGSRFEVTLADLSGQLEPLLTRHA
jgi:K+-sensing histidine kinase KdpD